MTTRLAVDKNEIFSHNPSGIQFTMKPLLILKAGGTYPDIATRFGDFDDWIVSRLDRSDTAIETVSPFAGEALPKASYFGGIVITGSHDMVTDRLPWSEKTADWVRQAVENAVPVLGICYGHQLLASSLGGMVGDNPGGKEFGTVSIRLNAKGRQDPLFQGLSGTFAAQACHSQSVLRLPAGATPLASSAMDANHAFAMGKRAWGVQFHPEFNQEMLRLYIRRSADDLKAQGSDVERLLAGIRETPESESLLRRFQRLCA